MDFREGYEIQEKWEAIRGGLRTVGEEDSAWNLLSLTDEELGAFVRRVLLRELRVRDRMVAEHARCSQRVGDLYRGHRNEQMAFLERLSEFREDKEGYLKRWSSYTKEEKE